MTLSLPTDSLPPGKALADVMVPGSKSVTNRALLLAAQARGETRLKGGLEAEDTRWLRQALAHLGIPVQEGPEGWNIEGGARPRARQPLWLGASGTTLRFLMPWLALNAEGSVHLRGEPRLFERPLGPLVQALETLGARWETAPDGGVLHPAPQPQTELSIILDASLSSQFVSGLALSFAGLPLGGRLRWVGSPASHSYLALTDHWLARFHCHAKLGANAWIIPGGELRPQDLTLPGDWSGAAAFLCAAAVTGRSITVFPLNPADPQGDRKLLAILTDAGCTCTWRGEALTVTGPLQRGIQADLSDCPDLAPVLAATAALAPGPSRLSGLETLPMKECDRLEASAELVVWLGGRIERPDGASLDVLPNPRSAPRAPFEPRRDHRMAFAAAVGALRCGGELLDPDCVGKTFPTFWAHWKTMLEGQ